MNRSQRIPQGAFKQNLVNDPRNISMHEISIVGGSTIPVKSKKRTSIKSNRQAGQKGDKIQGSAARDNNADRKEGKGEYRTVTGGAATDSIIQIPSQAPLVQQVPHACENCGHHQKKNNHHRVNSVQQVPSLSFGVNLALGVGGASSLLQNTPDKPIRTTSNTAQELSEAKFENSAGSSRKT